MPRLTWALAVGLSVHSAHAGPVEDAQSAEASGDVPRALAAWQRAAELAPDDARAQLSVGRLQLRAGRPAEAVQTLAAVVEKHPETPGAHYWYAFALRKSGRLPAAAESYRKALDAAPDDPDPRYGLAETLKQMGDGAGALEAYKAYVRLEARPSEAKWVARANEEIARLSASDVVTPAEAPAEPLPAPGAATAPPAATSAAPASATPDTTSPEAAFAAGRFGEAQRGFRAELERSPDNIALHHRTAVAALSAGDYPEAERRAVTVVRLDPDNPTATAMALAARGRRPPAGPPARAEAELALARTSFDRSAVLQRSNTVSVSALERAESELKVRQARVAALHAQIGKKSITAPFDGVVGLRRVDLGQYLQPGQVIVNLQDLSMMLCDFTVSQKDLPALAVGQGVRMSADAWPGEGFEGTIAAIEPQVDAKTGMVAVQASFANPDRRLRPGMFARVEIERPAAGKVVTVPASAVSYNLHGDSVFVVREVNGTKSVERAVVKLGDRRDGMVVIRQGIKPGDLVVTSGQVKLENGSLVQIAADDPLKLPGKTAAR